MQRFLPLWLVLLTTVLGLGCSERVEPPTGSVRSAGKVSPLALTHSANPTEVGQPFTLTLTTDTAPKGGQVAFAFDCKAGTTKWQDCDGQFTDMKPMDWFVGRLGASVTYDVKDDMKEGDHEVLGFSEEFGVSPALIHTIVPKGSGGGQCCVEVNSFTLFDLTGTPSVYGTPINVEGRFKAIPNATDFTKATIDFTIDGKPAGSTQPKELKPGSGTYGGGITLPVLGVGFYRFAATLTVPTGTFNDTLKDLHEVTIAPTTTKITSGQSPSAPGQEVTFTVTVQSPTATPVGSVDVDFGDNSAKVPVTLSGGTGIAKHVFAAGSYSVQADYLGTTNFKPSSASKITQGVNAANTALALTMPTTAVYGDTVSIKLTASGGASTPTGDVKFAWSDASGAHPIQTVTLVAGVASTSIATLLGQSAPYTITADYGGDGSHSGSTATGSLTITPKPTTLTIATNRPAGVPDGSAYGESVALTATVVRTSPGGAGAPAGTVTFYDGGIGTPPLGTFKLLGSTATLNIASLIVGNHNIVGVFTPTAGQIALNWGSSTNGPAPLVQKVRQAATKAVAITSNTPAGTGAPVTFSVNVGPLLPGAEPSGGFTVAAGASVMFKDGATNLGPGVPGSGSTWTFMTSTLAVGLHTITAEYGGNASFAASISNAVAQSVEAGVSSIKLTATKSPTTFGEAATFTADVMKPGVTTPTGNVVFTDGPRTLGSIALVGGSASVTVADLAAGPHAIQAQYETATATLPHSVLVAPTTTKLTSSINPAALGETTTLTATVKTPGGAIPTGSVLFKDNWTTIATVVLDATGKATTTLAGTTGGTHPLVAEYSGDTSLQASADSLSHVVNRAKSKLELASTPNPSRVGAAVTFTATVSALAPATAIPTGTVVFKEATTVLATVLLGANGSAVFTTTDLTDGKHIIDASFAETTDFEASSATLEQTVSVDATEISVTSSPNPSKFGVPVKITATLGGATAVPTGTVTFKTGTTTLGTGTVDGTGHADLTTSSLPFGTTSVIAEYEGDAASLKGSATTQHLVEKGLSSIAVESSANPAIVGASLSFTATVLAGGAAANGDVEFMDGSLSLGIVPIAGGAATLTTSTLSLGTHAISAKYLGSAQLEVSSSSVLTQSILAAAATPDAGAPPPTPTPPPAAGGSTPDGGLLPPTLDIGAPDGASDDCAMSRGPVKRGLGGAGMLVVLGLLALRRRRSTSR